MFAGIIQGLGTIEKFNSDELFFRTPLDLQDCKIGSSICCNGVCLTAKTIAKQENHDYIFSVNIGEETRFRTNLLNDNLPKSNFINIEKSIKLGQEISGHLVYGHVDCVTKILKIEKLASSWTFEFEKKQTDKKMNKFIVEKGSIAINGISLTVASLSANSFFISIISHTFENTNLNKAKENDLVNIEFDALARYVVKDE